MVFIQKQKYTSVEQERKAPMFTKSLTKKAGIYNEEKIVTSISSAEKTGQHYIKE